MRPPFEGHFPACSAMPRGLTVRLFVRFYPARFARLKALSDVMSVSVPLCALLAFIFVHRH